MIAGLRGIEAQTSATTRVRRHGVAVVRRARRRRRCRSARRVRLEDGTDLDYDRLVLAPGIDLRFDALPGYDEAAAEMHAACLEGRRADRCCCAASSRRWRTAASS